jgi:hypothetical protein
MQQQRQIQQQQYEQQRLQVQQQQQQYEQQQRQIQQQQYEQQRHVQQQQQYEQQRPMQQWQPQYRQQGRESERTSANLRSTIWDLYYTPRSPCVPGTCAYVPPIYGGRP